MLVFQPLSLFFAVSGFRGGELLFAGPCSLRLCLDARAIQARLPASFPIMNLAANDLRGFHVCLYQREGTPN